MSEAVEDGITGTNLALDEGFSVQPQIFQTSRQFFTHGLKTRRFDFDSHRVTGSSQVAASICEIGQDGTPYIGAADMSVLNVAPHDDGSIEVRFKVDWPENVSVRLNFIVAT